MSGGERQLRGPRAQGAFSVQATRGRAGWDHGAKAFTLQDTWTAAHATRVGDVVTASGWGDFCPPPLGARAGRWGDREARS